VLRLGIVSRCDVVSWKSTTNNVKGHKIAMCHYALYDHVETYDAALRQFGRNYTFIMTDDTNESFNLLKSVSFNNNIIINFHTHTNLLDQIKYI
jgi:hypothetical protein